MSALTPEEIDEVLLAIREEGVTVQVGGSRCHTVYGRHAKTGAWFCESFDEGATREHPSSEQEVRSIAADHPDSFVAVLRSRRWRELREAAARGDRDAARTALQRWRRWGDTMDVAPVVEAWLAPEAPIGDAAADAIRRKVRDRTLYHVYMDLHGWPRDEGANARAAAFIDELAARAGEPRPR